mmetsp:Transcript_7986/g.17793  ORF Transcript_7986/g.17793 Transcript_7986/m.17793 type:complete len:286 (-) Transcript_7986:53-910(-)
MASASTSSSTGSSELLALWISAASSSVSAVLTLAEPAALPSSAASSRDLPLAFAVSASRRRMRPLSSKVRLRASKAAASFRSNFLTVLPCASTNSTTFLKAVSFVRSSSPPLSARRCRAPQPRQVATTTPSFQATLDTETAFRVSHRPQVYTKPKRSSTSSCKLAELDAAEPSTASPTSLSPPRGDVPPAGNARELELTVPSSKARRPSWNGFDFLREGRLPAKANVRGDCSVVVALLSQASNDSSMHGTIRQKPGLRLGCTPVMNASPRTLKVWLVYVSVSCKV